MSACGWYRWVGPDLEVTLKVQPRAPKDAFVDAQGDHFRVRIKAPPVEGKANLALRRFLAESFGVPQSQVEILGGETARHKRLLIRAPRRLPLPIAGGPSRGGG